jgi:hypothetical protein
MSAVPSKLPAHVTTAYWTEVRRILRTRFRLSQAAAKRGIDRYRVVLFEDGVRDEIYHSPVSETAKGIADGGYANVESSQSSESQVSVKAEGA